MTPTVILGHFLLFDPPNNLKNQSFEKMKNTPGDIIILHCVRTKSNNHMIYDSWNMERNRQNCLSFWAIFLPFYFPNNLENQNLKKWKKYLEMCPQLESNPEPLSS